MKRSRFTEEQIIATETAKPEKTLGLVVEEHVARIEKEGRADDRTISKAKWLLEFAYPVSNGFQQNMCSGFRR